MRPGTAGRLQIKVLPYVAPALLLAIALVHGYLVAEFHLSPWKGGGFGMFSTVQSPAARVVRAYLVRKQERIPILIPGEFRVLERDVRTLPTAARVGELATRLGEAAWVPYQLVSAEEHYLSLRRHYHDSRGEPDRLRGPAPQVNRYSLENRAYLDMALQRMRLLRMARKSEQNPAAVPFERVEVEVLEFVFDQSAAQLRLRLIGRQAAARRD